jgi:hypothetical protein
MVYDYITDISKENERLCFREIPAGLSALVFSEPCGRLESIAEAREIVLGNALQAVKSADRTLWLIAGHAFPVRDKPLSAHKRLWKDLATFGVRFPADDWCDSIRRADAGEVRYFGYRKLHPDDLSLAESVCRMVPSFMVLATGLDQVEKMVGDGWDFVLSGVPREAFERSLEYKVPIVILLGEFDDPTADAAVIAPEAVIASLI